MVVSNFPFSVELEYHYLDDVNYYVQEPSFPMSFLYFAIPYHTAQV